MYEKYSVKVKHTFLVPVLPCLGDGKIVNFFTITMSSLGFFGMGSCFTIDVGRDRKGDWMATKRYFPDETPTILFTKH